MKVNLTTDEMGLIVWLINGYKTQFSTSDDICNSIIKKMYNPNMVVIGIIDGVMTDININHINQLISKKNETTI
jgi:hypothetical protein